MVVALVFAGVAVLVHGYIWVLESLLWMRDSTRRTFGVRTDDDARATRPLAFNQGFYNLFLALVAAAGIVAAALGATPVSIALLVAGCGSMVLAAVVLAASSPRLWRAALVQGLAPLLALALASFAGWAL